MGRGVVMEMSVKGMQEQRNSKIKGIQTGNQNDSLEKKSK